MNINQNWARWLGQFLSLLSMLVASSAAFGAGGGSGFAWANNPTRAQYTPDSSYSFNSTGGTISISRVETGVYSVTFAGLGGDGTAGGHVQVSAYGSGSQYCKVERWNSGRQDFIVRVRCFTARGAPTDTTYTISATWPQQLGRIVPASQLERPASVSREILPNGRSKITYADGSYKVIGPGGYNFTTADGVTRTVMKSTQAPPPNPPLPPAGSQEANWLATQADGLLSTISMLVKNDQQSIDHYLAAEGSVDVYTKIVKRRVTLNYMVSE